MQAAVMNYENESKREEEVELTCNKNLKENNDDERLRTRNKQRKAMITNTAKPPLFKIFQKKNRMSKKNYEKRILNLKKSNPGEENKKHDWTDHS